MLNGLFFGELLSLESVCNCRENQTRRGGITVDLLQGRDGDRHRFFEIGPGRSDGRTEPFE